MDIFGIPDLDLDPHKNVCGSGTLNETNLLRILLPPCYFLLSAGHLEHGILDYRINLNKCTLYKYSYLSKDKLPHK